MSCRHGRNVWKYIAKSKNYQIVAASPNARLACRNPVVANGAERPASSMAEHARAHGICSALEAAGDQMSGGEAQQQERDREHDHDEDRELRSITKADWDMSIAAVSSSPALQVPSHNKS